MSSIDLRNELDQQIDPNTGVPQYFNLSKKNNLPKIDWSNWRSHNASQTPLVENVGLEFEPYGGFKSADEGFSPLDLQDIPEARAQGQSGLKLAGNAFGQFALESSLGIPEAVGYVLDLEPLYNANENAEEGYDNFVSKYIREAKEGFQEDLFPIYQSHAAQEGSFSDRMSDPTFWAAQGKTLGNTIALMGVGLSAAAATGGIGGIMMGSVAASLVSAKAEATMEAYQAFTSAKNHWDTNPELLNQAMTPYKDKLDLIKSEYDKLSSIVYTPGIEGHKIYEAQRQNTLINLKSQYDQIRELVQSDLSKLSDNKAGEEAALVYKANASILIPSNFIQYATFMKPFAGIAKTLKAAKATRVGTGVGVLTNMASEGIYEEGGQQAAQWEAANTIRNGTSFFGEGFGDRLGDYLKDPEMQTNMAIGAAMGLGFDVAGHVRNKIVDKYKKHGALKAFAANLGDIDTFNKIDNDIEKDLIVKAVNTNQFEELKNRISAFASDAQNDESLDDNEKAEIKKKADKLIENATYVQEADAELVKSNKIYAENPNVRKEYVLTKFEDKKTSEDIDLLQKKLSSAINKSSVGVDPLTANKNRVVIAQSKIDSTKSLIKLLSQDTKLNSKLKNDKINHLNKVLEDATKERDENIAQVAIKDPSFSQSKYTVPNIGEIYLTSLRLDQMELHRDIIRQNLATFENKTETELKSENEKIEKEKKQNILNIQKDTFNSEIQNIVDLKTLEEFSSRVDKSGLLDSDKVKLKKQALDNYNKQLTRKQQQQTNNSVTSPVVSNQPKLIGFNEMPPAVPVVPVIQPKLIASNELTSNNIPSTEAGNAIVGDVIEIAPVVVRAPKLIQSNDLPLEEDIPDTTIKVLNDELKTDEVVPIDGSVLNSTVKEEEDILYQTEFSKSAESVSVASKHKESENGVDKFVDGHVVISKDVNENIFDPEYANIGTRLVLKIDTEYISEEKPHLSYSEAKNNIDLVPIIITNEAGEKIGYVHTTEWIYTNDNFNPEVKVRLIRETSAIRAFFLSGNNIDINKIGGSIVEFKSVGWVNLNPMIEVDGKKIRQFKSIDSAFKHDGQWDDSVTLMTLTGVDEGNIKTPNPKVFNILKGKTVVLVPGNNGQVITKVIKQKKLSEASDKIQKEFVHNLLGIIYNASYNEITRDELFEEVGKYLHATFKNSTDVSKLAYSNKLDLLFNLDIFEGQGRNVTISIRKPNSQNFDVYKVSQIGGKINISKRINVTTNEFVEVSPKEFEEILKSTLKNKYLNLSKKDLKNPSVFTRLVADDNYNVSRTEVSDYRDFISETGAASTSVHGVMLGNGKVIYATQPTIRYSTNITEENKTTTTVEEIAKPQEPVIIPAEQDVNTPINSDINLLAGEVSKLPYNARVDDLPKAMYDFYNKVFDTNFDNYNDLIGHSKYELPGLSLNDPKSFVADIKQTGAYKFKTGSLIAPPPIETNAKPVRKSRIQPKGKPTKLDSDDVQSLGSVDIDLNKTIIASFTLIPNVIQENELVGTLVSMYLAEFSQSTEKPDKKDASVIQLLIDDITAMHEDATAGVFYENDDAANAQVAKYTKILLDNFSPQFNEDGTVAFIGYETKLRLELERLKFDPLEEADDQQSEDEVQAAQFIDNKNFKEDPEKSASSRVKRGLISIPLYESGELRTNLIGTEVYRDYYEVFNTIMEATSDINIDEIKTEIEDLARDLSDRDGHSFNVYAQINELLNNSISDKTDTFYNEFMSVFKKQRTKFIKPIINTRKDVLPSINLYNSNKSGAAGILFGIWAEGVKNSPLVNSIKKELTANSGTSKIFNALKQRFDSSANKLVISPDAYYNEISDIFFSIGFTVSPEAIQKMALTFYKSPNRISDLEIRDNGELLDKFSSVINRSFTHLISEFGKLSTTSEDDTDDDGISNDLFKNQAKYIAVLARYETKVNPSVLSSSFRNGNGDVVYGFVNSHHLANTINELKNNPVRLNELRTDKFAHAATWLTDENLSEVELFYLDSAVNGGSSKSAVEFEDMSDIEKEQVKAALVLNKGSKKGYFLTPTPSDKTTFAILSGARILLDKNTDLALVNNEVSLNESGELIDKLYNLFVRSEIHRIEETVNLVKKAIGSKDFSNLIKGEHYDIKNNKVVLGSRGYFFLMPQMNEFFKERLNVALTSDHFAIGEQEIFSNGELIEVAAKKELSIQLNRLHKLKVEQWNKLGMNDRLDINYKQKTSNKIPSNYFNSYAAMDYVINSMVGYANQFMLATGDPATFSKADKSWDGTHDTWKFMVDGTVTNMFKRVAKDIAPGYEGLFEDTEKEYNSVFIEEPERDSKLVSEYEGVLKDQIVSSLTGIEFADAQEWTTLNEHVIVLAAIGRITREQKDNIIRKYEAGEKLTDAELGLVMQPMKPVQVGRRYLNGNPIEYYIKTSSFPLIPQLTTGLEIDAIRVFMEKNKIARLTPKSAVKQGFFNAIQVVDSKGGVLLDESGNLAPVGFKMGKNDQLSSNIHTLDRSLFRIQQDVPFDETKSKILEGSQMKKLKYSDLDSSWEFGLDIYDHKVSGSDLKKLDDDIHTEIYKRHYDALVEKLNATETRNGLSVLNNFGKLKELLIEEAKERGFDFNDLMLLNTVGDSIGVDGTPLFMHPALPKIEALLNSLIKNKVLVTKFPGKSYVQGSSMGFDAMQVGDESTIKKIQDKNSTQFLSTFTGSLGYKINKDGSMVAQVLLPWYFKDSMDKFIDKTTGKIDESKINPELLKLIGYRIPTQDHGSMIIMEVVGFLPRSSGDLIIISPEMSRIMGSDFDVDKLYVHKFNYTEDGGKLNKINPSSSVVADLTDEELQNLSLNITSSILSHPEITKRLLTSLDNTEIQQVLNKIDELKSKNKNKKTDIDLSKASNTSALFDGLHSIFVDINAAGKTGIGIGSIASTSHVLAQYAGVYIKAFSIDEETVFNNAVRFTDTAENRKNGKLFDEGNVDQSSVIKGRKYKKAVSNGLYRLDRIFGISGKRISQVIKNIQTEAVDNARNQRLFGMNLNKNTFDTALFLAKAGLDEEYIGIFLNQPIIIDYVSRLNNISDIGSSEFETNKREQIQEEVWAMYDETGMGTPDMYRSRNVSLEEMKNAISGKVDNQIQLDILESFIAYSSISAKLSKLFRAVNTDTKYLGKSLTSTIIKKNDFTNDFIKVKGFGNHWNLNGTLQMSAHKYGVDGSSSLYKNLLPYESEFFKVLISNLEKISGRDLNEDSLNELFSSIKNALWTESWAKHINSEDIDIERKRIIFGNEKQQSLAIRLNELKKVSNNTLIKLLNVKTGVNPMLPDVIEFPSAGSLEKDFSLKMQQSWMQLYNSNREFAMDLVSYSMINGNQRNARDFSRFMPIDILIKEGILDTMKSKFNEIISMDTTGDNAVIFLKQFIQHNPSKAFAGNINNFTMLDENNNKVSKLSKASTIVSTLQSQQSFVYFYDKDARGLVLFQLDGLKYVKVPTLGNKKSLLTEYNLSSPNKSSIFVENKPVVAQPVKIESSIPKQATTSKRDLSSTYGVETGVNVKYVLSQILKNGRSNGISNEGLLNLVDFLLANHGELLNTVNISVINDNSKFANAESHWGEINHATNTITMNLGNITPMSKDNKWNFPESTADEFFALVFAHELIHKITRNKQVSPELTSLFEKFKKDHVGKGLNKYKVNVSEFLSGLFTDKQLQNALNEMKVSDGKSLLDKIWDAIIKMISGDIQIIPGSMLEKTMQEAFKLISPEKRLSVIKNTQMSTVDKSLSWGELKDLPVYSDKGVMVMRKQNTNEHFGNPFTGSGVTGLIQMESIKDAVIAYREWLFPSGQYASVLPKDGEAIDLMSINPVQKQWILSQINQGKLDNKTFLYMKDKGEYYSHADALRDIVNERPSSKPTFDFKSAVQQGGQLDIGEDIDLNLDEDYGDIEALLSYEFTQDDLKEAEEVDKFCNGSKNKFGKIKK